MEIKRCMARARISAAATRPVFNLHSGDDLERSKQAHTVVSMLVDVHGFLAYDNREHNMAEGEGDDDLTVFPDEGPEEVGDG